MKTKLNSHCADGHFVHNTETGETKMQIGGEAVLFQSQLGYKVVKNSVRLWDGLQDDGRGNIVDREGRIFGSINYETGDIDIDRMKYQVLEIVTSALGNASDNLARAKLSFKNMHPDELDKEYGSFGQTCREIMDGYQSEVDRIKRCVEWVRNAQ